VGGKPAHPQGTRRRLPTAASEIDQLDKAAEKWLAKDPDFFQLLMRQSSKVSEALREMM
jgi:hypothetical protein